MAESALADAATRRSFLALGQGATDAHVLLNLPFAKRLLQRYIELCGNVANNGR